MFTPVTLPPGRLRLATRPTATGSLATAVTIGIVAVAALAASSEPSATNDVYRTVEQLGRQAWQSIKLIVGPPVFDRQRCSPST